MTTFKSLLCAEKTAFRSLSRVEKTAFKGLLRAEKTTFEESKLLSPNFSSRESVMTTFRSLLRAGQSKTISVAKS